MFLCIHPLTMATMTTTMMTMIPTPMHCVDISIANMVGANFLFLLMATREMATAVMTTTMNLTTRTRTMTTTTTTTMFPKLPYTRLLQVVTPPLLLPALLVETIFIWPFQPPILSNRVVTEMPLVPVTLCNNVFLLLTLPHL
jgi:hypothetical protein